MHEGDLYVEKNLYTSGNYYLDKFVLIPAGTIIMSAATTEPGGWLDCNGRTLLKGTIGSTYYDLFLAIGYSYGGTFGGSDLSFNIPDMRGRVGVGLGQGAGLSNRPLADISGAEMHTLTMAQMPDHDHGSNAVGGLAQPGLAFCERDLNGTNQNTATALDTLGDNELNLKTTLALSIDSVGGGLPHNNMQPYVVLRYLIKY
jgi:microcystin-dependent protein